MSTPTTESTRVESTGIRQRTANIWRQYLPIWFMTPLVVLMLLITIFPGVYDLYLSLVHHNFSNPSEIGTFAGLSNYVKAFTEANVLHSFKITMIFVTGALALETGIGFVLAVLVNDVENGWLKSFYQIVFILPMAVAPVSLATIGSIMLNPTIGIIPYVIETFTPFASPAFLTELPLLTVIVMDTWHWTPFMFIIFYAGLSSVPDSLVEAAKVDGAPLWRRYAHVVIPYMKPVIFVAVLIRLIDLFRAFGLVYSLTRGGPGKATQLVSINIFQVGFKFVDLGVASAIAIMYLVFILIVCNVLISVIGFKGVWN